MKRRLQRFTVSPAVLFIKMVEYLAATLDRDRGRRDEVRIRIAKGVFVSPTTLWGRFGETVSVGSGRSQALVDVPPFVQVWGCLLAHEQMHYIGRSRAFWGKIIPEELHEAAKQRAVTRLAQKPFVAIFGNDPTLADRVLVQNYQSELSEEVPWERVFHAFEERSVEEQRTYIGEACFLAAYRSLLLAVDRRCRKEMVEELNAAEAAVFCQTLNLPEDFQSSADELARFVTFLRIHFWEGQATPKWPIEQFLPPGIWPTAPAEEQPPEGVPQEAALPEDEVPDDDPRLDTPRADFYRSLGCRKVVEPYCFLEGRGYVAYLLRAKSGLRLAFVDTDVRGNAAYVFLVGRYNEGDQTEWARDATRTKRELLSGAGTKFMCRFFHSDGWERRVRRFLELH